MVRWSSLVVALAALAPVLADPADKVAATVNGEPIPLREVDTQLLLRGPQLTPITQGQLRQARLEIVGGMIDDKLVKQFIAKYGPKIDPKEVDQAWKSLEAAQKAQNRTVADFLRESNQTEEQVRQNITTMLQTSRYIKQQTTEETLRKYYEVNRDFFDRVAVHTRHVVLRVPVSAGEIERDEARQKLQLLREQISEGKIAFGEAAKKYSHCPSAPKEGDIGFIFRKWQVDEPYARAAFRLTKPGEISPVVETDFGFHLIQFIERKEGTPSKFETSVEDVRDCYSEEYRQALLAKLRKEGKIEITLP